MQIENIVNLLVDLILETVFVSFVLFLAECRWPSCVGSVWNLLKINKFCLRKVGKISNPLYFFCNGILKG